MARCPRCKGLLGQTDTICPNCGYDFPAIDPPASSRGFMYSGLANFALLVGQFVAGIGCLSAIVAGIVAFTQGELLIAFFWCPICAILALANMVVFARVLDQV